MPVKETNGLNRNEVAATIYPFVKRGECVHFAQHQKKLTFAIISALPTFLSCPSWKKHVPARFEQSTWSSL